MYIIICIHIHIYIGHYRSIVLRADFLGPENEETQYISIHSARVSFGWYLIQNIGLSSTFQGL